MSYHEIETATRYVITCRDCDYEDDARSAREAEEKAIAHIDVMEYDERPYYAHQVAISPITLIGRGSL